MRKFAEALYLIAVTLWVGGLWAVGYVAAPTLFRQLADRSLAGSLAGSLFAVIAWIGLACAVYLALFVVIRRGWASFKSPVFWVVLVMAGLTAAGHFGVTPILAQLKAEAFPREVMETVLRNRFATWHGISSGLYLVQSVMGLVLVVIQGRALR